jgi:chemotaxis protein MotB
MTGCVTQEKYNAMKLSRDQLADQAGQAEADARASRAQADAYRQQIDQLSNAGNIQGSQVANINQQLMDAKSQLAELRAKYEFELNKGPTIVQLGGSALPPALTNELQTFAAANPDIVDFDSARGVIKFKSDVTFTSGSTAVNQRAKDTLQRFASILNSPAAGNFELLVAGHTDNTPVTRKATIEEGNFDNWYLSVHRAIAVAAELVSNGVGKNRLGVAGYADQHPIASNASESGKSQNRRVEVMILPTSAHGIAVAPSSAPRKSAATPAAARTFNKDSDVSAPPAKPQVNMNK